MVFVPEHIKNLVPYKSGKPIEELAREKGLNKIVKLASNENPLGPSPKAIKAINSYASELHRYTDPSYYRLTHVLAQKMQISPKNIFVAAGSDAILQYIVTTFSNEGDELLTSEGTFIGWGVNVKKYNRVHKTVPLKDYAYNLKAIAAAVTENTRIIYLANPNNPTGSCFSSDDLTRFLDSIPDHILVVFDEAYHLYAHKSEGYPDGLNFLRNNVIVLRTFSKSYGLAGLRIGVAFGEENIIRYLYKMKLPFEPSLMAQEAVIAALDDEEFLSETFRLNNESLSYMRAAISELGIRMTETKANFFLMLFENGDTATVFNQRCLERGLILRHTASFGIPEGVRINSGTMEETIFAVSVINEVFSELVSEGVIKNHSAVITSDTTK